MRLRPAVPWFRLAPFFPTGLVAGPGSATDNALVRFDGAGGSTLQNSTVLLTDSPNAVLSPGTNDDVALGSASLMWSDLFLASGAVINFNAGDITLTHSANLLSIAGGVIDITSSVTSTGDADVLALKPSDYGGGKPGIFFKKAAGATTWNINLWDGSTNAGLITFNPTAIAPTASDGTALGTTSLMWSDLFLASGGVINFNAGNLTLTHSAGAMTATGAWTFSGSALTTNGGNGIDYAPGSDVDVDIVTIGVTGTPLLKWDETADAFSLNKSLNITTALTTGSTTIALLNATATTINFAGAATTLNIGASATCILNFGGSTTASEFRFLEPSGSGTNYTAFKAQAQAASITYTLPAAAGASSTFLTDAAGNGTLSWATVASGTATAITLSTDFTAVARFTASVTGGGTNNFNGPGFYQSTSATGTSGAMLKWLIVPGTTGSVYLGSPMFSALVSPQGLGTDLDWFVGLGSDFTGTGSAITYTVNHAGFKMQGASSVYTTKATQANGTTETASANLATFAAQGDLDLILKINSTTSIDYYTRLNSGSLSSATNLSTNMPSANNKDMTTICSNKDVATDSGVLRITGASYTR